MMTQKSGRLAKRTPSPTAPAAKADLFTGDEPFVDGSWTAREAFAQVTTGPHRDYVQASVRLLVEDDSRAEKPAVDIMWEMVRRRDFETIIDHPLPHPSWSLGLDEIEAFAGALSEAVRIAKERGLLSVRT